MKREGYEDITLCDKCLTYVFYSRACHYRIEAITNLHHTDQRCELIQESKKTEINPENAKTMRPQVIDELRQFIADNFTTGTTIVKMLYEILKVRKTELYAVTARELAAALFPREVFTDRWGIQDVKHEAIERVTKGISRMRKIDFQHSKGTLVFSKKWHNGQWYYYNIQTKKDVGPVTERLKKTVVGIAGTIEVIDEITGKSIEEREEAEKEMTEYLQSYGIKKPKKKSNGGDGTN